VSKNAAVSGATAPQTAYKYLCAHAEIILTQMCVFVMPIAHRKPILLVLFTTDETTIG
jgi:hypothetical protein